ncbi:Serine protease, partial [Globisporangium splendens]
MASLVSPDEALRMASKLRRLTKARRQEIHKLDIHLRAKRFVQHCCGGPMMPLTMYSFVIRDTSRCARGQQQNQRTASDGKEWVVEKRFSECYGMKRKLQSLVHMWTIRVQCCGRGQQQDPSERSSFEALFKVLCGLLTMKFPRRRLRCDSDAIVRERCVGLYDFVRTLLDVYAEIYVHIYEQKKRIEGDSAEISSAKTVELMDHRDCSASYDVLWGIYLDIVSFLKIPDCRKVIEYRHALAILSLEDMPTMQARSSDEFSCCICFDEGFPASDENNDRDDDHDDTCEEDDSSSSSRSKCKTRGDIERVVWLPCGHQFHEGCVIAWFCTSETCPLCRQSVLPFALAS